MTDEDLVQIRRVIKEEIDASLEPVKTILEKHTKKLDALWDQTVEITEDVT